MSYNSFPAPKPEKRYVIQVTIEEVEGGQGSDEKRTTLTIAKSISTTKTVDEGVTRIKAMLDSMVPTS